MTTTTQTTPTTKTLMRETHLSGLGGAGSTVRTIRQVNGSFVTIGYLPAGVDIAPLVIRYDAAWEAKHEAMIAECGKLIGAK